MAVLDITLWNAPVFCVESTRVNTLSTQYKLIRSFTWSLLLLLGKCFWQRLLHSFLVCIHQQWCLSNTCSCCSFSLSLGNSSRASDLSTSYLSNEDKDSRLNSQDSYLQNKKQTCPLQATERGAMRKITKAKSKSWSANWPRRMMMLQSSRTCQQQKTTKKRTQTAKMWPVDMFEDSPCLQRLNYDVANVCWQNSSG